MPTSTKSDKSNKTAHLFGLNGFLRRYVRLRGVSWRRYSRRSKLTEEYGELLEALKHYDRKPSRKNYLHLQEEMADVFFCLLGLSERRGFDLNDAVEHKIAKDTGRNGGSAE